MGLDRAAVTMALLFVLTVVGWPPRAGAADPPSVFIADLGSRLIAVLSTPQPQAERERQFRTLIDEGFDMTAIARVVLGPHWAPASEAERQEFVGLFTLYVVQQLCRRASHYDGVQLTAIHLRAPDDAGAGAVVDSRIAEPGQRPKARVAWRVASSAQGHRVTDVIVDGISIVETQHQQLTAVIRRAGGRLEVLLRLLRLQTSRD